MTFGSFGLAKECGDNLLGGVARTADTHARVYLVKTRPAPSDVDSAFVFCTDANYSYLTIPLDGSVISAFSNLNGIAIMTGLNFGSAAAADVLDLVGMVIDLGITRATPENDKWIYLDAVISFLAGQPMIVNYVQFGELPQVN